MFLKENLTYLIKKRRLKLRDLAEILGVAVSAAGNYTSGRTLPKYESLIILSEHFNISCDDLLKKDLSKEEPKTEKSITQNNKNRDNILGSHFESTNKQIDKLLKIIQEKDKQLTMLISKL